MNLLRDFGPFEIVAMEMFNVSRDIRESLGLFGQKHPLIIDGKN